jgi:hypothetical protein
MHPHDDDLFAGSLGFRADSRELSTHLPRGRYVLSDAETAVGSSATAAVVTRATPGMVASRRVTSSVRA